MGNTLFALQNIDWALLRRQKRHLLEIDDGRDGSTKNGVISLLDSIQDAFVADGLAAKETVFGTRFVVVNLPIFITATVHDVNSAEDAVLIGWGENSFDWDLKTSADTHDWFWAVSDCMMCDARDLSTGEETEHELHDDSKEFEAGNKSFELTFYAFITVEVDHATSVDDAIEIALNLDFSGDMVAHSKNCSFDWVHSDGCSPTVVSDENEELDSHDIFIEEDESDDGVFITNILMHDVKCFLRDDSDDGDGAPSELDDSSIEHIERLIREGYREGELCVTDGKGNEWRGWWKL